jgi:acyl dehydratase
VSSPKFDPKLIHWEDIAVGQTLEYGGYKVTKEEIFEFAGEFDPQAHHLDEEAAKKSLTKGLCSSGWHSCAMFMRMMCDGYLVKAASLGASGVDETRWTRPVRPGDVLKARSTAVSKRVSKSRPGVGLIHFKHEILNDKDELVMTSENTQFIAVRNPEAVQ